MVDRVLDLARDVLAIGPGLGQAAIRSVHRELVERATMPLVVDADG
jgi:NAD(P)H-hydrate repair Nnr-like enzyme with NAD(P)H-hydrate dehydratase domain